MNKAVDTRHPHAHAGGWVPRDQAHVARWVQRLRQAVTRQPRPLVAPIAGLKALVEQDPLLHQQAQGMFDEAWQHEHSTPLGQAQVRSFDEFLQLLNGIMTTAPEAYQDVQTQEPAGLIGFPINALLNWPMATAAGYDFFANALVNQQLRKILGYWADFLQSPASRYVLTESVSPLDRQTLIVPWLGDAGGARGRRQPHPRALRGDLPHRAGRGIRGLRQLGRLLHPPLLPRRAAGDGPGR
jgi:phosphatidylserine decarboxylase